MQELIGVKLQDVLPLVKKEHNYSVLVEGVGFVINTQDSSFMKPNRDRYLNWNVDSIWWSKLYNSLIIEISK